MVFACLLYTSMDKRREGIRCGIPSYCSANELVIEIALRRAKERNIPVLDVYKRQVQGELRHRSPHRIQQGSERISCRRSRSF